MNVQVGAEVEAEVTKPKVATGGVDLTTQELKTFCDSPKEWIALINGAKDERIKELFDALNFCHPHLVTAVFNSLNEATRNRLVAELLNEHLQNPRLIKLLTDYVDQYRSERTGLHGRPNEIEYELRCCRFLNEMLGSKVLEQQRIALAVIENVQSPRELLSNLVPVCTSTQVAVLFKLSSSTDSKLAILERHVAARGVRGLLMVCADLAFADSISELRDCLAALPKKTTN